MAEASTMTATATVERDRGTMILLQGEDGGASRHFPSREGGGSHQPS
jgi:hypothetical protein